MRVINVKYFIVFWEFQFKIASSLTANFKTFELKQNKFYCFGVHRYYDTKVEKLIYNVTPTRVDTNWCTSWIRFKLIKSCRLISLTMLSATLEVPERLEIIYSTSHSKEFYYRIEQKMKKNNKLNNVFRCSVAGFLGQVFKYFLE